MRTTCVIAVLFCAACITAVPVNDADNWDEAAEPTMALAQYDSTLMAKKEDLPQFLLSTQEPWKTLKEQNTQLMMINQATSDEERNALAITHARNAIAELRKSGHMVLTDDEAELMVGTIAEVVKKVGEVLWNNAEAILIAVLQMLVNLALDIKPDEMTALKVAVDSVFACTGALVAKTDVPKIDGTKKWKNAKGAMVACTLAAVQANIQTMISLFCKFIATPWLNALIPTVMPTPANAATWLVWITDAGRTAIVENTCPALQIAVCAGAAKINGAIQTSKKPAAKALGHLFSGFEIFLCAVSPGNVAGKDMAEINAKKFQAGLDNARKIKTFVAATGAKWDAAKKQFNCGGKPCNPTCADPTCGPMFHQVQKNAKASNAAKPMQKK